jgi:glycosyltransferase involved in cell wall biosynthesis
LSDEAVAIGSLRRLALSTADHLGAPTGKVSAVRISVCIPTVRPNTVGFAIASIRRQTFADWELTVIGQGDEAALRTTTEQAAAGDERVHYLHSPRGLSRARNAGIARSTGEIIAFLDDDCEADERWLETLDTTFSDGIGFVSGAVIAPPSAGRRLSVCPTVDPDDVEFDPAGGDPPPGFRVLGANIAVRRTDAERIGSFDECMGAGSIFQGGEEHDYVHRLAEAGVRMRSTPASIVHHTYGVRSGIAAVYRLKRERIRGDGAVAAKGTLLEHPTGGVRVRACVLELAKHLVGEASPARLPLNAFRIYHYLTSYRECLRGYTVTSDDVTRALLVDRPAGGDRSRTAPVTG